MFQLALIIGCVIFFAMAFFTLGFIIGKQLAKDNYIYTATDTKIYKKDEKGAFKEVPIAPPGYPKGGIRSTFTIDEPSGPVMRPTASELRKMEEDEITRANKDAVAEVFRNEEPPSI